MSVALRVAARFAARATIKPKEWAIFGAEKHFKGEAYTYGLDYPVRAYLSEHEVANGKRQFKTRMRDYAEMEQSYTRALKERSGPAWDELVKISGGDEREAVKYATGFIQRYKQAEHAKRVDDVRALFRAEDGPAFADGEPLLVGSVTGYKATQRGHLIELLRMHGTEADLRNFLKTKATLSDHPDPSDLL